MTEMEEAEKQTGMAKNGGEVWGGRREEGVAAGAPRDGRAAGRMKWETNEQGGSTEKGRCITY